MEFIKHERKVKIERYCAIFFVGL